MKSIVEPMPCGKPMSFASITPVKGFGKVSMILWAILHTYMNMREAMTKEMTADFLRWDVSVVVIYFLPKYEILANL